MENSEDKANVQMTKKMTTLMLLALELKESDPITANYYRYIQEANSIRLPKGLVMSERTLS